MVSQHQHELLKSRPERLAQTRQPMEAKRDDAWCLTTKMASWHTRHDRQAQTRKPSVQKQMLHANQQQDEMPEVDLTDLHSHASLWQQKVLLHGISTSARAAEVKTRKNFTHTQANGSKNMCCMMSSNKLSCRLSRHDGLAKTCKLIVQKKEYSMQPNNEMS